MQAEEFERLYHDHAQGLFAFLAYRTGDRASAEDLVAETFERVLRAGRRFDARKASQKTWLYAIALNCWRDHARRTAAGERAQRRAEAGGPSALYEFPLDEVDARDAVHRALGALSAEEREAIALRFGADLTIAEIAEVTGEAFTTAQGRVYRGLRRMREGLADYGRMPGSRRPA